MQIIKNIIRCKNENKSEWVYEFQHERKSKSPFKLHLNAYSNDNMNENLIDLVIEDWNHFFML